MQGRKHKLKVLYLVFIMIFVVSGCSSLIGKTGSINGVVKEKDTYHPLAGAKVTVGDKTAKTDQNGSFNIAELQVGTYQLIVTLADYQTVEETITVAEGSNFVGTLYLQPKNRTPVLTTIGDQTVAEGATLNFVISATDPENDPLTYSASSTTPGLADHFDPTTQTFNWAPTQTDVGTYQITFTVSDGVLTATETIQITVTATNDSPVFQPISNQSVLVGETVNFVVSAIDPDGDALTYQASSTTAGLADYFDVTTQTFNWTPIDSDRGVHRVIFTASDGEQTATQIVTITVDALNHAPVLEPIGDKTLYEDGQLYFILKATDADGDSLTYSATSPTPSLLEYFRPEVRTFNWTPTQEDVGTYEITFSVTDGELTAEETILITVMNINDSPAFQYMGDQFVNETETLTFNVVANDQDGDTLIYSMRSLTPGVADYFDAATQTFSWTPTPTDVGDHTVIFSVTDGEYTEEMTLSIRVNGAPQLVLPGEQLVHEGEAVSFAISGTDANGDDLTYTCTTSQLSNLTFDDTTLEVNWLTDFNSQGSYELTFEVSDGHLTTTETVLVTVENMDITINAPLIDMVASNNPSIVYGLDQVNKKLLIINPYTRTLDTSISLPITRPIAMTYSAVDQKVYILDEGANALAIYNELDQTIIRQTYSNLSATGGKDIEVAPSAGVRRIYILTSQELTSQDPSSRGLTILNMDTFANVANVNSATFKGDLMVIDEISMKLYTADTGVFESGLMRYSVADDLVTFEEELPNAGSFGQSLAISPDKNHIAFACEGGNSASYAVNDFNPQNFSSPQGEWLIGTQPLFVDFNPASMLLYGTNSNPSDENLYVMDVNNYSEVRKLPFPNSSDYSIFTTNSDGTALIGFSYDTYANNDYRIYFFENIQM